MFSRKILVAYDGSPGSKKALNWTLDLARKFPVEVVIAAVIVHHFGKHTEYDEDISTDAHKIQNDELDNMLRDAEELFKQNDIAVKKVIRSGIPADELIDCAEYEQADLICAGTRGYGNSKKLMLGSVAHKLVTYSPISVVVIK